MSLIDDKPFLHDETNFEWHGRSIKELEQMRMRLIQNLNRLSSESENAKVKMRQMLEKLEYYIEVRKQQKQTDADNSG